MNGNRPILIYTSAVTNRLKYVCDFVFKRNLQVEYSFIVNISACDDNAFIIEYSAEKSESFFWLYSEGLLNEVGHLRAWDPGCKGEGAELVLYPCTASESMLPFDVFSAIFYCISLYQAYTLKASDEHGRLDYRYWFLREKGLDQFPMVETWIERLRMALRKEGVRCADASSFKRTISFDIDHCFAYSERSMLSNLRSLGGDFLKGRWKMLADRIAVWRGLKQDPYILDEHLFAKSGCVDYKFFVLMKEGGRDSLNLNSEMKQKELQRLQGFGSIGLHPSYEVGSDPVQVDYERKLLEDMLGQAVANSRQHFLRQSIPVSQENLMACGIMEDHSIGYYDQPGLMACCSLSFPFYNLSSERHTELELIPFFWMDSMNKYYRQPTEEEERAEIQRWEEVLKERGGCATYVFHNDSMVLIRYRLLVTSLSEC